MAANQNRVRARVTEILNLCDAGTYTFVLSSRNKTRNEDAIKDIVIDAGLDLLRVLAETPNEFRSGLVSTFTPSHLDFLPEHVGKPAFVEIQKYDGADWEPAAPRDYKKIVSYRSNAENIYDDEDHDAEGSINSGLYDIWDNKFYFTGFAARVGLIQITRADPETKIPEILEPVWIRLAVGHTSKAGDGTYSESVAGQYGAIGKMELDEFKAGRRNFPEVSDPEPTSAVHV